MTPASQIIERLGGFQAVADLLGNVSANAVQRWTYPTHPRRVKGEMVKGLGDRIPMRHWAALVATGRVSLDELMPDDVAQIISASAKPKRRKAA